MPADPHDTPQFTNSVEYLVKITIRVTGGARHGTADQRARRVAAQLANAAVRSKHTVDVHAVTGPSHDGEILWASQVRFTAANSGTADPNGTLDRWLDPEHELALRSLAAANARDREQRSADRRRRLDVGCCDPNQLGSYRDAACRCVYCEPESHERALRLARLEGPNPFLTYRCLCGRAVLAPGHRCLAHLDTGIVVLDQDSPALQRFAQHQHTEPDS